MRFYEKSIFLQRISVPIVRTFTAYQSIQKSYNYSIGRTTVSFTSNFPRSELLNDSITTVHVVESMNLNTIIQSSTRNCTFISMICQISKKKNKTLTYSLFLLFRCFFEIHFLPLYVLKNGENGIYFFIFLWFI